MKHFNHNIRHNIHKSRAIAKVIRIEIYIAIAMMLLLSLAALPAKAAMTEDGATFFEYASATNMHFDVGGAYAESQDPVGQTEHMTSTTTKDVMLKAHYEATLSNRATFEFKGGVGVTATDTTTYSANDRTAITPAFKVGMGIHYTF